jgi:hypothetical protein
MWPYWLLFLIPAVMAVTNLKSSAISYQSKAIARWPMAWRSMFFFLLIMIGLRHEVGGDWTTYIEMLESYTDTTLADKFVFQDPAFIYLNQLTTWLGTGIYLINLISAIFFTWGLIVFCRDQPRPWLALVVAVPYLITVVAMGYTRQGVAIGLAMVAMVALGNGQVFKFILWIAIASLFHKSAIILIPMAILSNTKNRFFTLMWVLMAGVTLFLLILKESTSFLLEGYIQSQYQSSGAAIRVTMNAMPAIIFLILRKRFSLTPRQRSFWTLMAWSSLLFIALLLVSQASTAIDRIALYWIPLQLFVLSRLPDAIGKREEKNLQWIYTVVIYSATVHFVWLFYADTAFAWLPYQFYPWIWLWL